MGAVQILRVAVTVALAAVAVAAGPAHAAPPDPPAPSTEPRPVEATTAIPIALIELRAKADDATRAPLRATLTAGELVPIGGDLGTALLGRDLDDAAASTALAEAQDGFGQLDCGRARPSAELAVRLLAARAAAGFAEQPRLARAWTYVVLCAERDGDRSTARFGVERLRALGAAAGAVPADLWSRYPDIDAATDRDIVELTVTGPAGATAWVDDRALGPVPAKTFVHAGRHLIAVAAGPLRGATIATALGQPLTVDVAATAAAGPQAAVAAEIRGHQAAGRIDAAAVATVLGRAAVELAIVLEADGTATLWQRDEATAFTVTTGPAIAVVAAARQAATTDGDRPDRSPASGEELLREDDVPDRRTDKGKTRWWVYAAIGGAVVLGAVTIYAVDAGDDRQRFELRF